MGQNANDPGFGLVTRFCMKKGLSGAASPHRTQTVTGLRVETEESEATASRTEGAAQIVVSVSLEAPVQ